eukprot:CAMPEP_0117040112 /NCGR_PEP_ID=MMETSP0472-20121206/28096_1 /TAXON_ID=693140 ORGANISM="Tiarina fusus, Strain LIS" /NCGR_SAMPLE_ID=MMETSP0472 /ASSEMBLY_ACC=CAM_ASM_000603 /LENGTH=83 /DNA_ID=CAMNT_0004750763 /DNA_START=98 /DNA_END=349 /DNA_ORIENTATION=+
MSMRRRRMQMYYAEMGHAHHNDTSVVYANANPSSYQAQPYTAYNQPQQHQQPANTNYSPYSPYSVQGDQGNYPSPPPQPSYVS